MSSSGTNDEKPKPFSIALSSKKTPTASASKTKSQPRFSRGFHEHDSDNEDDRAPEVEEVTGFDHAAGGAIRAHSRPERQPLVIKVESSNNWRDRVPRRRGQLIPEEAHSQKAFEALDPSTTDVEGPNMKYGLTFATTSEAPALTATEGCETLKTTDRDDQREKPLSQDELAIKALIRESKDEGESRTDLVIPSKKANEQPYDETRAFREDVKALPDASTLEQYNAIPVEEFGAALLRGMGWKDGQPLNRNRYGGDTTKNAGVNPRIPSRRPGYLGIGAKDISGKGDGSAAELELGAWGKSAMKKSKKEGEGLYTPVLVRNKTTGELISENELKNKIKDQTKENYWRERRGRTFLKNGPDYGDYDRDFEKSSSYRNSHYSAENSKDIPRGRDRDRGRDRSQFEGLDSDRRYHEDSPDDDEYDRRHDRYYRYRRNDHRNRRHDRYVSDRNGNHDRSHKSDHRFSRHSSRRDLEDYRPERDKDRDIVRSGDRGSERYKDKERRRRY